MPSDHDDTINYDRLTAAFTELEERVDVLSRAATTTDELADTDRMNMAELQEGLGGFEARLRAVETGDQQMTLVSKEGSEVETTLKTALFTLMGMATEQLSEIAKLKGRARKFRKANVRQNTRLNALEKRAAAAESVQDAIVQRIHYVEHWAGIGDGANDRNTTVWQRLIRDVEALTARVLGIETSGECGHSHPIWDQRLEELEKRVNNAGSWAADSQERMDRVEEKLDIHRIERIGHERVTDLENRIAGLGDAENRLAGFEQGLTELERRMDLQELPHKHMTDEDHDAWADELRLIRNRVEALEHRNLHNRVEALEGVAHTPGYQTADRLDHIEELFTRFEEHLQEGEARTREERIEHLYEVVYGTATEKPHWHSDGLIRQVNELQGKSKVHQQRIKEIAGLADDGAAKFGELEAAYNDHLDWASTHEHPHDHAPRVPIEAGRTVSYTLDPAPKRETYVLGDDPLLRPNVNEMLVALRPVAYELLRAYNAKEMEEHVGKYGNVMAHDLLQSIAASVRKDDWQALARAREDRFRAEDAERAARDTEREQTDG